MVIKQKFSLSAVMESIKTHLIFCVSASLVSLRLQDISYASVWCSVDRLLVVIRKCGYRFTLMSLERGAEDMQRTWNTLPPRNDSKCWSPESRICSLVFFRSPLVILVLSYNRTFPQDLILVTTIGRKQIKNCQVMRRHRNLHGCKRVSSACVCNVTYSGCIKRFI